MISKLYNAHIELSEDQAERLQQPKTDWYTVEARPPPDRELPACPASFIQGIREMRTKWLGLRNTSPVVAFEVRRSDPDRLRFQYSVPTRRLERKLRNHLADEISRIEFTEGTNGLPVTEGDTIGGATASTGRPDYYPLQSGFDAPPVNALAGALHRHAMQDTRFVIQIMFRSVAGKPVHRWWYRKHAHREGDYLRSEKEQLIGRRKPTSKEKKQAQHIGSKATGSLFETSIRFIVIGAEEHSPSRLHEVSGAYSRYENRETGQYLKSSAVKTLRRSTLLDYCRAVANRRFGEWGRRFKTSVPELAALVSLPDRSQENIQYARAYDT